MRRIRFRRRAGRRKGERIVGSIRIPGRSTRGEKLEDNWKEEGGGRGRITGRRIGYMVRG